MSQNYKIGIISAAMMVLLPWLTVTFVRGDAGMAICFILFFAVYPLFSIFLGVYAGRDVRRSWLLPLLNAVLFLAGVWICFDLGEPAFIAYALAYLAIGSVAMLVAGFVRKKRKK